MTAGFDVWVPEQSTARVLAALKTLSDLPALESTGGLDGDVLKLPVTVNDPASGAPLTGDQQPAGASVIGWSTGYDVFGRPGWTPGRFAEFVPTRSSLYIGIGGGPRPTLGALASYLQSPMMVDEAAGDRGRALTFITTDGNVTRAEHAGDPADSATVRDIFFNEGLDKALSLPGVTVNPGPVRTFSVRNEALNRRMDIASWHSAAERGEVPLPKGAELHPLNVKLYSHDDVGGVRPVLAFARSSEHLYQVIVPDLGEVGPLEVTCTVDGIPQRYIDPATGEDKGFGAHAADWCNWILRDSVPAGQRTEPAPTGEPWQGDGLDASMYRLAHSIVNYEDHHTDTTYFSTAADVEAWLRRSLGGHNAPITVGVLDDITFTLDADGPALIQRHIFDRAGGLQAGYQPNAFRPWAGAKNWWDEGSRAYTRNPSLETVMDGQKLESYAAVNCLDYADLEPFMLPAGARADEGSWFVIRLGDTPTCIALPAQRTILTVSTDHDGASAEIAAHQYFRWIKQNSRRRDFEEQWERWLDDSRPLSKDDIQAGLKTLEQIIERSDDEPDDE
jgi:hypothetical protein